MRKQAKELIIGRVYADINDSDSETTFLKFIGLSKNSRPQFARVKGKNYGEDENGIIHFPFGLNWYELTPADEALLNTPPAPIIKSSTIQAPDIPRLVALAVDKCREKMDFVEVDIEENGWKFEAGAYYNGGDVYFEEVRISPIWDDKFNRAFVG